MLVAKPFERDPAAKSTRADSYGDECDEHVECFRHLEAQSTSTSQLYYLQKCIPAFASGHWRVCSNCQREIGLQCFLFFFFSTQSSIQLRKPRRRKTYELFNEKHHHGRCWTFRCDDYGTSQVSLARDMRNLRHFLPDLHVCDLHTCQTIRWHNLVLSDC